MNEMKVKDVKKREWEREGEKIGRNREEEEEEKEEMKNCARKQEYEEYENEWWELTLIAIKPGMRDLKLSRMVLVRKSYYIFIGLR